MHKGTAALVPGSHVGADSFRVIVEDAPNDAKRSTIAETDRILVCALRETTAAVSASLGSVE